MKKILVYYLVLLISSFGLLGVLVFTPSKALAAFDRNNLCSDAAFINSATLNAAGIQSFLKAKGSFLQNYSDGGRSAAQIIYDYARSNRINPVTILAMIQKEEGIIYGSAARTFNQTRVDWAMGYGYTDSTIYTEYKGFTNQIDHGSWQLRRNYDFHAANGSVWNVGKTMIIDGQSVRFANRCTSSLYRYTPHLGTNFTYYLNLWNTSSRSVAGATGTYDAQFAAQGPRTGVGAPNVTIKPKQRFTIWVNYKNTGGAVWYKGTANPVRLGMSSPQDRGSAFTGGSNIRGTLAQAAVRPGQTGTFRITLTAPASGGTYTERFRPLAEHITWMGGEATFVFNVAGAGGGASDNSVINNVRSSANGYNAQYTAQGPRTGAGSSSYTLSRGQKATLWVNYRNTGSQTWYKGGANPVHLGTSNPQDRGSVFLGGNNVRGRLIQSSVAPGAIGTFTIMITAPQAPGTYQEVFRPLAEYATWMGDTATWILTVR